MEFRLARVTLRTVTHDDRDEVARMWNFEKGEIPHEEAAAAIDRMMENHRQNRPHRIVHACFAVFEHDSNGIIGWCGLDGRRKADQSAADIFYLIDRNHRGRGYATECAEKLLDYGLNEMKIARIDGACAKDNDASRKILQKIGMRQIGAGDGGKMDDGSLHFVMTREDYEEKHCGE